MHPGLIGAIAGGLIGMMGGAIGVYVSLKHATRPRERSLMIRFASLTALWLLVLVAWLFLMPPPWGPWALALSLPALLVVPWVNRRAVRARALDQAEARIRRAGS